MIKLNKYGDEKVLCVPRWYYESAAKISNPDNLLDNPLETSVVNVGYFDYRNDVEMDESVLQVIPYVVLRYKDRYFITQRLGGDERLQGMCAFIGGHVDVEDTVANSGYKSGIDYMLTISEGLIREIEEETTCKFKDNITNIAFDHVFIDNSAQVSRCHVCQLVIVDVNTKDIKIKETDKLIGNWVDLSILKLLKEEGKTEGWASIVIDYLNKIGGTQDEI